jgi:hypothetical protein
MDDLGPVLTGVTGICGGFVRARLIEEEKGGTGIESGRFPQQVVDLSRGEMVDQVQHGCEWAGAHGRLISQGKSSGRMLQRSPHELFPWEYAMKRKPPPPQGQRALCVSWVICNACALGSLFV